MHPIFLESGCKPCQRAALVKCPKKLFQLNDLDLEPADVKKTLSFEDGSSSSKLDEVVGRGPAEKDKAVDAVTENDQDKPVTEEQGKAKGTLSCFFSPTLLPMSSR